MHMDTQTADPTQTDPSYDRLWELYHENSKLDLQNGISPELLAYHLKNIRPCFDYSGLPRYKLTNSIEGLQTEFGKLLDLRRSCRNMDPGKISSEKLSALLFAAYGKTGKFDDDRIKRTVPSAGGLYPLEIYLYSSEIEGIPAGLFHYSPLKQDLTLLRKGRFVEQLAKIIGHEQYAYDASAIIFITGVFGRTAFKYRERGYRYTLIEAGHVGQNIALAGTGLDLGVLSIGGFFDRKADEFLEINGVDQATLYLQAIGIPNHKS